MLKGDLSGTPLAPLLLQLADDDATGCLHISDAEGDEALVYFKSGQVYAISVPGRRPQLGAKLVSSGALAPEALADALEAQRVELQGWRLGELLVHLGYVDQPVVEAFVKEQVHDALWDLIRWTEGRWKFRKNEKTREDVAPPMPVSDLLANLRSRGLEWEAISAVVHGPTAIPVLSARGGGAPETTLDPDAWSMLCKIDGERSVAELARDCGYTMFEAGQVLVALVNAGLVDIEEDVELHAAPVVEPTPEDGSALYGATSIGSALAAEAPTDDPAGEAAEEDADPLAALARLVTEVAATVREPEVAEAVAEEQAPAVARREEPQRVLAAVPDDQSFATSIARVSAALSEVLGPGEAVDLLEVPATAKPVRRKAAPVRVVEDADAGRRRRARDAAAAELAAAHALAEALRSTQAEPLPEREALPETPALADVVDLAVVRQEAEAAARQEADRLAAQQEAERLEAERLEAERLAAEEAARAAAAAEAALLEAERLAAEEAARLAAEEEAARVAAEEEAARLAVEEAARVAAEEEAARLAAEEAARVAAEEEAARLAAEEAERLAAEEAARLEAERLEAERLAAEEEAARVAAEEEARLEAERLAAEEAERLAAEEIARLAAEEAERLAAEEIARLAAEEADRLAAEIAEAEEAAWAEHQQREAEAAEAAARRDAEATALLVELAQQTVEEPAAPADEAEPVPDDDVASDDAEPAEPAPYSGSDLADTAALLRELSSLGLDDEPAAPSAPALPPPRAPQRTSVAAADKKKKRGLFGR